MVMLRQASAAESFFNPKINIKPAVEQVRLAARQAPCTALL
jgi:hypothetical protein